LGVLAELGNEPGDRPIFGRKAVLVDKVLVDAFGVQTLIQQL
jgi:hypothetical protein